MFDVSAGELFLILIVAVVALGPTRAATLMRKIARWLDLADARWRDISQNFRGDNDQH